MTSRDSMLRRIREALGPDQAAPPVPRTYRHHGDLPPGSREVVDLLVDRLLDYRAQARLTTPDDVADRLAEALATATSVVLPPGLDDSLLEASRRDGRRVVVDGEPDWLTAPELDRIDAVVTRATVAIAINGTIILDGGAGQGRRIITLVPDLHVIVLRADQIVETMTEGLARLEPERPTTMIAGPSATSDIELNRVEGVHGPRTLHVLIARAEP